MYLLHRTLPALKEALAFALRPAAIRHILVKHDRSEVAAGRHIGMAVFRVVFRNPSKHSIDDLVERVAAH